MNLTIRPASQFTPVIGRIREAALMYAIRMVRRRDAAVRQDSGYTPTIRSAYQFILARRKLRGVVPTYVMLEMEMKCAALVHMDFSWKRT